MLLLRASKSKGDRLRHYGIANRITHTSILFALHPSCHLNFHHAMLSLHKTLTKSQQRELSNGRLHVTDWTFRAYGAVKPLVQLRLLHAASQSHHADMRAEFAQQFDNLSLSREEAVVFVCPHGHPRPGLQPPFRPGTPSRSVWCATCHKSISGLKWLCPCKKQWHTCSLHYNCIPVAPSAARANKRTRGEITYMSKEQEAKKLTRLATQDGVICKRLRCNLIGNLAEKFSHLER